MSGPIPEPDESVDALIRAYLDQQAARVETGPALDRIRESLGRPRTGGAAIGPGTSPGPGIRGRLARRWVLGVAAASLLLGAMGVLYVQPKPASAETIVRQARATHALPMDRCYRVEIQSEADLPDGGFPRLARPRQTRLWTRGDRFWIESDVGPRHLNWGRDPGGTLWLALSKHRGIRFDPGEVPEAVAFRCDVLSVRLETLLGELPRNFVLRSEPGRETGPHATTIIRTRRRPGRRPILQDAELEVDAETNVLRRMVLTRTLNGRSVTTTFTLEETRTLADSSYELEGHLESPYQVDHRDFEPQGRRQLLLRLFGVRTGEGVPANRGRAGSPRETSDDFSTTPSRQEPEQ